MSEKKVSVLMSVYNGELFLQEAMDGILDQTYSNWECIVIDDCSTDRTPEILKRYAKRDARIRVYTNETNMKLPGALNRAIQLATGEYLLRMDADDLCSRDMMEKETAFMDMHPEIDMSCGRLFIMQDNEIMPTSLQRRGDAEAVEALMLFFNPICHPGVIIRRESFPELAYDPTYTCTEDLELWTRMLMEHKRIAVQDDYYIIYRMHDGQVSKTRKKTQREQYYQIAKKFYQSRMFPLSDQELTFLSEGIYHRDYLDLNRVLAFLYKVIQANKKNGSMGQKAVRYAAFEVVKACKADFPLERKQFSFLKPAQMMRLFRMFSIGFFIQEFIQRKQMFRREVALSREAAKAFGMKELYVDRKDKVPRFFFPES